MSCTFANKSPAVIIEPEERGKARREGGRKGGKEGRRTYLGGILELYVGEKVTSSNNRAGGETVSDSPGLGGLEGHDHLHGLDLKEGRKVGREGMRGGWVSGEHG